jgi:hypothetical protein
VSKLLGQRGEDRLAIAGVFAPLLLVEADNVATILDFDFFELQSGRILGPFELGGILIQGALLLRLPAALQSRPLSISSTYNSLTLCEDSSESFSSVILSNRVDPTDCLASKEPGCDASMARRR